MVAQAFVDFGLVVLFVLLDPDDLRGAGLAGTRVLGAGEGASAGALRVDAGHRVLHEGDMLGLQGNLTDELRHDRLALAGARVLDIGHDMRPVQGTAVGDRRGRGGEL